MFLLDSYFEVLHIAYLNSRALYTLATQFGPNPCTYYAFYYVLFNNCKTVSVGVQIKDPFELKWD